MRHRHHVTIQNRTNFETNRLRGGYTSYTITGNTKLEDELTPKGGGNVTVGVPGVTWLRVLACGLVGGVERQNSNICTNRTFCKYPLLSLALYR